MKVNKQAVKTMKEKALTELERKSFLMDKMDAIRVLDYIDFLEYKLRVKERKL